MEVELPPARLWGRLAVCAAVAYRRSLAPTCRLTASWPVANRPQLTKLPYNCALRLAVASEQFAALLRLDERGQPPARALAELATAENIRQDFQVRHAVDVEVRQLGV